MKVIPGVKGTAHHALLWLPFMSGKLAQKMLQVDCAPAVLYKSQDSPEEKTVL